MSRPRIKERPPKKSYTITSIDTLTGTLLPAGHVLYLNPEINTLLLITTLDNMPCLVAEQQFTNAELCVIHCFFANYPHYTPYERVLAHFNYGKTGATEERIVQMRKEMEKAQRAGGDAWDELMRPMRNVTSRTRPKLAHLGIAAVAFLKIGYVLMPFSQAPGEIDA